MATSNIDVKNWTIYKIVNPENQVYIGRSSRFKERIDNYRRMSGRTDTQPLIYESLIKYGFDAHQVSVIDEFCSDNNYAEGKEIFWIRSYMSNRTQWPEINGLNKTRGGQGSLGAIFNDRVSPMKGKNHTEETKKVLSDHFTKNPSKPFLGKKHSEETRKRQSDIKKGKKSLFKGVPLSIEHRIKVSTSKKGKPAIRRNPPKKRTIVVDTSRQPVFLFDSYGNFIKELNSKREAERVLGIGKGLINSLLNGFCEGKYNGLIIKKQKSWQ